MTVRNIVILINLSLLFGGFFLLWMNLGFWTSLGFFCLAAYSRSGPGDQNDKTDSETQSVE